jgi:hypothetical protein
LYLSPCGIISYRPNCTGTWSERQCPSCVFTLWHVYISAIKRILTPKEKKKTQIQSVSKQQIKEKIWI